MPVVITSDRLCHTVQMIIEVISELHTPMNHIIGLLDNSLESLVSP